jgi:hypothetical protein
MAGGGAEGGGGDTNNKPLCLDVRRILDRKILFIPRTRSVMFKGNI